MAIYLILVKKDSTKNKKPPFEAARKLGIIVCRVHPLEIMNVFTKCHGK